MPQDFRLVLATAFKDRVLVAILAASTILKVAFLLAFSAAPRFDEIDYVGLAQKLVATGAYGGYCFRPPLYPAYIASMNLLGLGNLGALIGQILVSTVSVWLVYLIVMRHVSTRRTARVAATLFAFDPLLAFFTRQFFTETLFLFFMLLLMELLLTGSKNGRLKYFFAAGITLGVCGLTRPIILPFAVVLAVWIFYNAWRDDGAPVFWIPALKRVMMLAGASILVVAPWTARNFIYEDAFILVDTNGPYNIHLGNNPKFMSIYNAGEKRTRWDRKWGYIDGKDYKKWLKEDVDLAQKMAVAKAMENIQKYPGMVFEKALWSAGNLWELDNFLIRHLRRGAFNPKVPDLVAMPLVVVSLLITVLISLSGLVGLTIAKHSPLRSLVLLLMTYFTLVFMATFALSRYGVPFRPILMLFGAGVLCSPRQAFSQLLKVRSRPIATALLVLALIAIGVVWARDVQWNRFDATQPTAAARTRLSTLDRGVQLKLPRQFDDSGHPVGRYSSAPTYPSARRFSSSCSERSSSMSPSSPSSGSPVFWCTGGRTFSSAS